MLQVRENEIPSRKLPAALHTLEGTLAGSPSKVDAMFTVSRIIHTTALRYPTTATERCTVSRQVHYFRIFHYAILSHIFVASETNELRHLNKTTANRTLPSKLNNFINRIL